jgi:hypothetical protein
VESEPYSGPAQLVLKIDGDPTYGNCPTDEFPSVGRIVDVGTGSFDLTDPHYLNADGSCGDSIDAVIHGAWSIVNPA